MTSVPPLNSVELFLAVVRESSIGAAAKRVGLPEATVRAAIKQLEQGLGAELLTRTARGGVTLTETGRRFHNRAVTSFEELEATFQAATDESARSRVSLLN